jgi:sugar lactone lactonase YvrE
VFLPGFYSGTYARFDKTHLHTQVCSLVYRLNSGDVLIIKAMKHLIFLFICIACISNSGDAQIISTIAGDGSNVYTGDGGQATAASLYNPLGVAADAAGNVYISDTKNHSIRKVNTAGIISTIAGTGVAGYGGDGGPATDAQLNMPSKVAVDDAGNVYIVDNGNYRIRKINTAGIISTIVGNGTAGNSGDGGPATDAQINASPGLAIDASGNIFFSDVARHTIRKINTTGIVTTIAGSGVSGYTGDGGPATAAKMNEPFGIGLDQAGNLYVTEYMNNCVREISASGIISTITGALVTGYSGDGWPATAARLYRPFDVVVDHNNEIYIGDYNNSVIRKISIAGIISTIAGTGVSGFSGDGGPATAALLRGPSDVAIDHSGNLIIADYVNSRIRRISNVVAVRAIQASSLNNVNVFPNPCNGRCKVQVSANDSRDLTVLITDILGRRVAELTGKTNSEVVIEPDVPDGIYIVTVMSGNERTTEKLSVVR